MDWKLCTWKRSWPIVRYLGVYVEGHDQLMETLSLISVTRTKFEPGTSGIQVWSVAASTNLLDNFQAMNDAFPLQNIYFEIALTMRFIFSETLFCVLSSAREKIRLTCPPYFFHHIHQSISSSTLILSIISICHFDMEQFQISCR